MHITIPILLLLLPLASASSLTLALHNTPTCARLDPIAPRTIEIDTWTCYNISTPLPFPPPIFDANKLCPSQRRGPRNRQAQRGHGHC